MGSRKTEVELSEGNRQQALVEQVCSTAYRACVCGKNDGSARVRLPTQGSDLKPFATSDF